MDRETSAGRAIDFQPTAYLFDHHVHQTHAIALIWSMIEREANAVIGDAY